MPTPSRIALANAYLRAAHQLIDPEPRLLDDPVAVPLLGPAAPEQIQAATARYRSPEALALRSHVMLRTRYTEDRLARAVERGCRQYLVLGAGFETFAYRQPAWASALSIVEVDAPAAQEVKRRMLAALGLADPPNLRFADIDLGREPLKAGLARHHIPTDTPTFVSWLGLSMYLEQPAVDEILRTVAACPAGSELVMTFAWPLGSGLDQDGSAGSTPASRSARAGEPWVTFFMPPALEQYLRDLGFSRVRFLTPAEADEQYFAGRPGDLPAPRTATIVAAIR
ncbi:MAG: class I SAM-dependent methyltransferase [Vicinamibacterales bacterium]